MYAIGVLSHALHECVMGDFKVYLVAHFWNGEKQQQQQK